MMMIKKCKQCKKRKEIKAKYFKRYYQKNKKKLLTLNSLAARNKHLEKRFGFILKLYLHNKNVSSDGCIFGNSRVIKTETRRSTIGYKRIILYKISSEWGNNYKIQIINSRDNEEFWFRFKGDKDSVNEFFEEIKRYPINFLRYLEMEKEVPIRILKHLRIE